MVGVSYGRVVLSGVLQSFHLSSAFTGTTVVNIRRLQVGWLYLFLIDIQPVPEWQLSQSLNPIFGPWESSDLNYGWEVHIVYLSREDKIIIVKF